MGINFCADSADYVTTAADQAVSHSVDGSLERLGDDFGEAWRLDDFERVEPG